MLSWGTILYGAALSALAAGLVLVPLARPRRLLVTLGGMVAAAAGAIAWNAILRATHADQFFTDAPIRLLPASWQDTGSGVFAFAAAAIVLGVGALHDTPTRRTVGLALLVGLAAFAVDVYLY